MKIKLLTKKQNQVMTILWKSKAPLSAGQINNSDETLNMNTVQQVLHALLKMEYIKVADIGYSNTVLTRLYTPVLSQSEYIQFLLGAKNKIEAVACLIEELSSMAELDQLQELIDQKKKALA